MSRLLIYHHNAIGHKRENEAEEKGYKSHSYHSWDYDEAKKEAAKLREGGLFFAKVVPVTQANRRGSFTAYSVYKKPKKNKVENKA